MRTFMGALALGLVCAIAGCKTDGSGGDGKVPAEPIPEDELPDATAAALCELFFGCSCENPEYPDEPTCVDARRGTTSEEQLAAQAAGLVYDDQCAGELLALAEASGCAPQLALDCDTFCAVYHGQQTVDQPCSMPVAGQPTWSDCAQGLWCIAGTCMNPCGDDQAWLQPGDMCRDEDGQSLGICDLEQGLVCDFQSRTCIALPGVGEPCYLSEVCGPGATCDWSGDGPICVPTPGAGEACTYECAAGFYCDGVDGEEGTCVVLPGEGQACASGSCDGATFCNDQDVCEALPGWVCSI